MNAKDKRRAEALAELREYVASYQIETLFAQVVRAYHDADGVPRSAYRVFAIDPRGLRQNYAGTPVIHLTRVLALAGDLEFRGTTIRAYNETEISEAFDACIFGVGRDRRAVGIRLHLLPL